MREKYQGFYEPVERPNWTDFFLGLCFDIAERSEDAQTKHGCIITDQYNHIIGTGYNGFAHNVEPGELPNTRPLKYDHIRHAEHNAILNCTIDPLLVSGGAVCYCTGRPCLPCLYILHDKNINKIYHADTDYHFWSYENEKEDFDYFVNKWKIQVYPIKANLNWLSRPLEKLRRIGLVD